MENPSWLRWQFPKMWLLELPFLSLAVCPEVALCGRRTAVPCVSCSLGRSPSSLAEPPLRSCSAVILADFSINGDPASQCSQPEARGGDIRLLCLPFLKLRSERAGGQGEALLLPSWGSVPTSQVGAATSLLPQDPSLAPRLPPVPPSCSSAGGFRCWNCSGRSLQPVCLSPFGYL